MVKIPKITNIPKIPNLRLKQLSIRQIGIIIVAVSMVTTFLIIWRNIYNPMKSDFKKVSTQLVAVNKRIAEVEGYMPPGETTQAQALKLKEDFTLLTQKLPAEEGETMNMLMDLIRSLNLQVESTKTSEKRLLLDAQNAKLVIDGNNTVEVLMVSLKLKITYKELIDFIATLRKSIPAYLSVQRLVIDVPKVQTDSADQSDHSGLLNATLDMNMYLLSKIEIKVKEKKK